MISSSSPTYLELLQRFPPRPLATPPGTGITTPADFVATQAIIDALLDQPTLTPDEQDYLNVLGSLVYEYEERHVSIPQISGVALLKVLIEEQGLPQKDLVSIFKTESIAAAVLNGQCQLNVEHIEKLATYFHVSPAVFFEMP
jgi:HTH-type transcriptional regulator / antitoxin HigA